MKILGSNLGATPGVGGPVRNLDRAQPSSVQSTRSATLTPTDVDRIDVGDDARGHSPEERLDKLASRFEARLDRLLEKDGLTDEQRAALGETKAEFQALVDRLANALDTLEPGVAARSFHKMVQDLGKEVRATLSHPHDDQTRIDGGRGGDDIDPGSGVPRLEPDGVRRLGDVDADEPRTDALDRLDDVQERFDARFEKFVSKRGLDEGVAEALLAAKEQFDSTLGRLQDAFSKGDHDAGFLRSGFQTALADLREELAAIFAGSRDDHGEPDRLLRTSSVSLYRADGAADLLSQPRQASLDHTV
jgi:hypothetical protein